MFRFNSIARVGLNNLKPGRIGLRPAVLRQHLGRRLQSTANTVPPPPPPPKKATGMKALIKEYGYSALGVYLFLTAIDLPICYVLVHSMGRDQIEQYENKVKQYFGFGKSDEELAKIQEINRIDEELESQGSEEPPESQGMFSYILSQFSWTEFAIAYGIHKSFIVIRLPITAAITPSIVKILRGWGFKIGTDKLATTATLAKNSIKDFSASSPKFGTKVTKRNKWFSWFF